MELHIIQLSKKGCRKLKKMKKVLDKKYSEKMNKAKNEKSQNMQNAQKNNVKLQNQYIEI